MIERIHLDPKIEKNLAALRKSGRRESLVADRVEAIIAEAERGRLPSPKTCNFTRNGEDRIKGCRKYDLGGGYRMITLKQGVDLYLLFVGTHDDCGRWIENHRIDLNLEMVAERCRTISRVNADEPWPGESSGSAAQEPDEDWLPPVSDHDLRVVFSGLLGDKSPQ
jgi:hypothetical protein